MVKILEVAIEFQLSCNKIAIVAIGIATPVSFRIGGLKLDLISYIMVVNVNVEAFN